MRYYLLGLTQKYPHQDSWYWWIEKIIKTPISYGTLWKYAFAGAVAPWITRFLRRYNKEGRFSMYVINTYAKHKSFAWFHDNTKDFAEVMRAMHSNFYNIFVLGGGFICNTQYTLFNEAWWNMYPTAGDSWHLPEYGAFSWGVVALTLELQYLAFMHSQIVCIGHYAVWRELKGCMFIHRLMRHSLLYIFTYLRHKVRRLYRRKLKRFMIRCSKFYASWLSFCEEPLLALLLVLLS